MSVEKTSVATANTFGNVSLGTIIQVAIELIVVASITVVFNNKLRRLNSELKTCQDEVKLIKQTNGVNPEVMVLLQDLKTNQTKFQSFVEHHLTDVYKTLNILKAQNTTTMQESKPQSKRQDSNSDLYKLNNQGHILTRNETTIPKIPNHIFDNDNNNESNIKTSILSSNQTNQTNKTDQTNKTNQTILPNLLSHPLPDMLKSTEIVISQISLDEIPRPINPNPNPKRNTSIIELIDEIEDDKYSESSELNNALLDNELQGEFLAMETIEIASEEQKETNDSSNVSNASKPQIDFFSKNEFLLPSKEQIDSININDQIINDQMDEIDINEAINLDEHDEKYNTNEPDLADKSNIELVLDIPDDNKKPVKKNAKKKIKTSPIKDSPNIKKKPVKRKPKI